MNYLEKLFKENEIQANKYCSRVLLIMSVYLAVLWVLTGYDFYVQTYDLSYLVYAGIILLLLFTSLFAILKRYESKYLKYIFLYVAEIFAIILCIYNTYTGWVYFILPIVLSARYYNEEFTAKFAVITIILMFLSQCIAIIIGYNNNYLDVNQIVNIPYGTTLTFSDSLVNTFIKYGYINENNLMKYLIGLLAFAYFIIGCTAAYCYSNAKAGRELFNKLSLEYEKTMKAKNEADKANMSLVISQIRPHFLYNSLTAIMAIDNNPPETIEAIGNFGKYLRNNLNNLSGSELISFNKELEHIKNYVDLEYLRFKDKLTVKYDIDVDNFMIPPLCVQMLVENSIKHGLSSTNKGGVVLIKTSDDNNNYYVDVNDNGCGFDSNVILNDENKHIGLYSCEYRLKEVKGTLKINSKIGKGTSCRITIPKVNK